MLHRDRYESAVEKDVSTVLVPGFSFAYIDGCFERLGAAPSLA